MKIVRPITITDAMLVSSTVPEPDTGDPAVWSSGTNYTVGATARNASTHLIYKAVAASGPSNGGAVDPTTDTDASHWVSMGGVSRWAMFDNFVSTATVTAASPLTVTIAPGYCDALYLYGLVGDNANVTMRDGLGGPVVYTRDLVLKADKIADWYAYYFDELRQIPYFTLTDLPPYLNGHITLNVTASAGGVACGMMLPGKTYAIGDTEYGVRVGIRDYSRKTTDEATGFTTLEQRRFAKTMSASVSLKRDFFAEVQATLEGLRATPTVWVGDDGAGIEPLTLYGFYKDFYLVVQKPTYGVYNLEIEGMV